MFQQFTASGAKYGIQLLRTLKNCNNIGKIKSQYCTGTVYNEKQEEKILMALNNSTEEDLARLMLGKQRVSKICEFIEQNGKFESLQQFHHLLNLKEKTLTKVCNTILGDKKRVATNFCNSNNITMGNEPASARLHILPSVVGISLGLDSSFSYAEVTTDFELREWGHISPPEISPKKANPLTIYDTVKEACDKLPIKDAYVLESMSSLLPQQTFLPSYLLKREMQAMLIALLNSRLPQQHRVYFLRSRIISRLYKIQVGSERVSSQPLVEQLLNGQGIGPENSSKLRSVDPELEAVYHSQTGQQKEAKANALLLGMAFLKLAVHGDLVCQQALKVSEIKSLDWPARA